MVCCVVLVQWTPQAITFSPPPGVGTAFSVVVRVSQLCSTMGCLTPASQFVEVSNPGIISLSYSPPVIQTISPDHGPTVGGYRVAIRGANFGVADAVVILHCVRNGRSAPIALAVVTQSHAVIEVEMEAAAGVRLNISVAIGGQTAWSSTGFSYDPPVIYDVRPAGCDSDRADFASTRCNWLAAPMGDVIIMGANFGPDLMFAALAPIMVTIGNDQCMPRVGSPAVYYSDSMLLCTLIDATVGNKSVSVSIAGQTAFVPESAGPQVLCDIGYVVQSSGMCAPCPSGAVCSDDGGDVMSRSPEGFWTITSVITSGVDSGNLSSRAVVPCTPALACTGGNTCAEGYTGAQVRTLCH